MYGFRNREYGSVELNTGFSSVDYAFVWYKGGTEIDDEQQGYITVTEPENIP